MMTAAMAKELKVVAKGPDDLRTIRKVSKEEKECTVTISKVDGVVDIFVSDNTLLTRIKRAWRKNPDAYVCIEEWRQKDGNIAGYRFLAPWKAITFNSYARWPDDQEEGEMDEDEDLEEDEEEDEISQ